jgi:thiamine-phosphate pyrophosphorylase
VLLYYITDRLAFRGDEPRRRRRLLDKIAEAANYGIDYIQLREKDLSARDLESLAREALQIIRNQQPVTGNRQPATAVLINSRTDLALATTAAGVHLPADSITPQEVRAAWHLSCGADTPVRVSPANPIISISCHSPQEVTAAAANQATLAIFAPIFEKKDAPATEPTGLNALREACRAPIPVLALGGITLRNAHSCAEAGAAGIAAIRLFQENDIASIIRQLRPWPLSC